MIDHASNPVTSPGPKSAPHRLFVLGATGTIGQSTVRELVRRGHDVVCFLRQNALNPDESEPLAVSRHSLAPAEVRFGDVTDPKSLAEDGFRGERFDTVVSCLASRTGTPRDAWAIDYKAHVDALPVAQAAGVAHIILLSAICVQKPLLGFQHAKLAFENHLIGSGMTYSIVRPTAFFKSLSGQMDRVRRGKKFLLFGDGEATACKPISDDDLGRYLANCLDDGACHNRILPIGGPGDAITPRQQGTMLFAALGLEPRFQSVPIALLDGVIRVLSGLGKLSPSMADKAELARIGRYYATESMLVINPETGSYDAAATPSFGTDTLQDHYARIINGDVTVDLREHAVF